MSARGTADDVESPAGPAVASGPLTGLRVAEFGQLIAGPFVGQLLGDLGADVIKVEAPRTGDPIRQWGRELPRGESMWWAVIGRNKRTVAIDLRTTEGQDVARALVGQVDIVIENFRPGTFERWGLDYESLAAVNPGLIMVRVSGYGQSGPYAARAGFGAIGEALGGLRYVVGDPSLPPSRVGISIGDTLAAMFGTIGALAALHERTASGRGQIVDAAIFESVLGVMESLVPEWDVAGYQRERSGSILPNVAPSNAYPTADGSWILIAANQDSVFSRFAEAIGRAEWVDSVQFGTHSARGQRQEELDREISAFTSSRSTEDLERLMEGAAVPCGRIYTAQDMLHDEHFRARETVVRVPHPVFGSIPMQNVFPRLSRTAGTVRWAGAGLGDHTEDVLSELGYDDRRIAGLRERGIVQ